MAECEGEDFLAEHLTNGIGMEFEATRYSTNWAQGGPIIERSHFSIVFHDDNVWTVANARGTVDGEGPTFLIAAMRCYVASKMGVEVEIQEELA